MEKAIITCSVVDVLIFFGIISIMALLAIMAKKQTAINDALMTGIVNNRNTIQKLPRTVNYKAPKVWRKKKR